MTLTDRQRTELEFLAADLGKFSREAPLSTIKRELTRALHEAPFASPERVIGWVINCLDRVVAQWERPELHLDPKVTDGVRQAATIICQAAERAGLSTPTQPVPRRPGEPASAAELAEVAADTIDAQLSEGVPDAVWVPSDGGLTPSMFGGI